MKRNRIRRIALGVSTAAALAGAGSAAAATFTHLRTYNLDPIFTGAAGSPGNCAIDVAFDGVNVYLAGYSEGPMPQRAGAVRINNILALPSLAALAPVWIDSFDHNSLNSDSRLNYWGGTGDLYLGTGFVQTVAAADPSGVRVMTTANAPIGMSMPGGFGYNVLDTQDMDPGFMGAGPVSYATTSGFDNNVRLFDPATGAFVAQLNPAAGTIVGVRDISFDRNGNLYFRRTGPAGGLYAAPRNAAGFNPPVGLIVGFEPDGPQATLSYVPVSDVFPAERDLVLRNHRGIPGQVLINNIPALAPQPSLLGNEITVDGVVPPPFGSIRKNYSCARLPGNRLLVFVVHGDPVVGPMRDRLDIYEIHGAMIAGDVDADCDVDLSDLATLLGNFGMMSGATHEDGDLDGDGDVDLSDLAELLANFGRTC